MGYMELTDKFKKFKVIRRLDYIANPGEIIEATLDYVEEDGEVILDSGEVVDAEEFLSSVEEIK